MITKQLRITIALLVFAAMPLVAVSAGQVVRKVKPQPIVKATYLKCDGSNNDVGVFHLIITNNSSSTIQPGTKIHWYYNSANNGSFTLQQALPPARAVDRYTGFHGGGGTADAKAWYYK